MKNYLNGGAPAKARYSRTAGDAPTAGRRFTKRTILTASILTLTVLAASTAAFAFWVAATSGSGSGNSGSSVAALTVSPGTVSTGLRPGGTTNVVVSVANTNTFAVRFSTLTLDTTQGANGFGIDTSHSTAGCTPALAALTFTGLNTGWTVPPSSSTTITATAALAMGAGANTNCQGATITIYVKAS